MFCETKDENRRLFEAKFGQNRSQTLKTVDRLKEEAQMERAREQHHMSRPLSALRLLCCEAVGPGCHGEASH